MEEVFDIATKKITGTLLSSIEEAALAEWLCYDENRRLYFELEKVWKATGKLSYELTPDIDAEWDLFKNLIPDRKIKQLNKKLVYSLSSIAASIILFFGIWGAIQIFSSKEVQYLSGNAVQQIQLPDQSIVHLNKNSFLTVDKNFNTKNRNVTLAGEAFFEVSENQNIPFIVKAIGGIQAEVLGTRFNLKYSRTDNKLCLNVFDGKVLFGKHNTEQVSTVLKGQQITYDLENDKLSQLIALNSNSLSWKTKDIQFDNTPIVEVASLLGEMIGKKVVLPNNSDQLRYSGSFSNPYDQQVAEILALAMGWDYTITNESVVFSIKNRK